MKKTINNLIWGSNNRTNGLIAFAIVGFIALGCACPRSNDQSDSTSNTSSDNPFSTSSDSDSEMPDQTLLKALVKETTADFAGAISTGDFSRLYNKASKDFQSTYTLQQTQDVFKEFVNKKSVVGPILAKAIAIDPQYSPEPSIRTEKGLSILVVNGKYATKPVPTNFEYEYVKRDGTWKMLKLVVKLQ
jgi:hypothetical protein